MLPTTRRSIAPYLLDFLRSHPLNLSGHSSPLLKSSRFLFAFESMDESPFLIGFKDIGYQLTFLVGLRSSCLKPNFLLCCCCNRAEIEIHTTLKVHHKAHQITACTLV